MSIASRNTWNSSRSWARSTRAASLAYSGREWDCCRFGEEEGKGNELTREAYTLLRQLPLNFAGNVEGRDLYNGNVDVIVCDGFIGNVALKVSEGLVTTVRFLLKESLKSTISSQVGFLLSRRAFDDFKKRLDYAEYGGAPLLGLKGVCIVGHGSSNATAMKNAIRVAAQFADTKINGKIEKGLGSQRPRREPPPAEGIGAGSAPV
jgi:glycerol-3-phosphate acyltransferase PlsX